MPMRNTIFVTVGLLSFLKIQETVKAQVSCVISNQAICRGVWQGGNVSFATTTAGTGPFTYQWQFNGTNLPTGIITTVAGNSWEGYSTDGINSTNARLRHPSKITVDAVGNLFISDQDNHRICKVSSNGILTTVAGNSMIYSAGDGGAATNASISPNGVAVDTASNLFIADYWHGNYRVRKVNTAGIITTVAGNGTMTSSGDGGAATSAGVIPYDVAVDSAGNLFIADNCRIRKVTTSGIITTVAGNGTAGYSGDGGAATNANLRDSVVTVDTAGNLFIAENNNNRIRKISTAGVITTVAGNGTAGYSGDGGVATNASLYSPYSVKVDICGNLFIADQFNNRIRKVSTNGIISTVAGNGIRGSSGDGGAATNASLWTPYDMAVDTTGNLFIADYNNNRIRKVGTNGIITTFAGNAGDSSIANSASLNQPYDVAVDAAGNLFIADYGSYRVRKVNTAGIITTVAGNGTVTSSGDGGAATNAGVIPGNLTVDSAGNLFIADNCRIRKVTTSGIITTVAGNGTAGYSGDGGAATNANLRDSAVKVDIAGNLFIAESSNNRIRKVTPSGVITTVAGNGTAGYSGDGGAATNASLNSPTAVSVDSAGNLFIADYYNYRIRKVDSNGIITTVAGNGFGVPCFNDDGWKATNSAFVATGLAFDNVGNLLISDNLTGRIRSVDSNGIITTVAGNRQIGYIGDGDQAINACMNNPCGIAVNTHGYLFIADKNNNVIRRVTLQQGPFLDLNGANPCNEGSYQVVVTGPSGSVTSSVAKIMVTATPLIYQAVRNVGGGLTLGFISQPGSSNVVLAATSLGTAAVWQPVSTNQAGADGNWQFTDTTATNYSARFYRSFMR